MTKLSHNGDGYMLLPLLLCTFMPLSPSSLSTPGPPPPSSSLPPPPFPASVSPSSHTYLNGYVHWSWDNVLFIKVNCTDTCRVSLQHLPQIYLLGRNHVPHCYCVILSMCVHWNTDGIQDGRDPRHSTIKFITPPASICASLFNWLFNDSNMEILRNYTTPTRHCALVTDWTTVSDSTVLRRAPAGHT